jgi:hypothetical protein
MRRTTVFVLAVMLMLGSPTILPVAAQGQGNPNPVLSIPVGGVVSGTLAGVFQGTANINRFAVINQAGTRTLVAVGTLTGTVTDATGAVVQSIVATFTAPVTQPDAVQAAAVCSILNLVLGPIHLDLLGLVVDTNQILVNVTAVSGAGNLLGNLLCAVTGLLDGGLGGALGRVANLLNAILASL